jgi:hypothetical protein
MPSTLQYPTNTASLPSTHGNHVREHSISSLCAILISLCRVPQISCSSRQSTCASWPEPRPTCWRALPPTPSKRPSRGGYAGSPSPATNSCSPLPSDGPSSSSPSRPSSKGYALLGRDPTHSFALLALPYFFLTAPTWALWLNQNPTPLGKVRVCASREEEVRQLAWHPVIPNLMLALSSTGKTTLIDSAAKRTLYSPPTLSQPPNLYNNVDRSTGSTQ